VYICRFWGQNSKSFFWAYFFIHQVKKLIFSGPHAKFQPLQTKRFEDMAVLSGQKGVYLPFWGSKFKINLFGHI
jgi:hypothetical protein